MVGGATKTVGGVTGGVSGVVGRVTKSVGGLTGGLGLGPKPKDIDQYRRSVGRGRLIGYKTRRC